MKKVTVAIPVYNSSKYINECIDSILNQSISKEELEIICIDDCSSDNSLDILEDYMNKYPEIIKIIKRNKNSGGASAPRNNAIDMAKGEYIFFVDSDDYLGIEAIERMYDCAKKNNSDVVIGKYKGVGGRGVPKAAFEKGNVDKAEIIENSLFYTLAPSKMFKMDTIKNLSLKFDEDMVIMEDQLFVISIYCNCRVISIISDYNCYYWRQHEGFHLSKVFLDPIKYFRDASKIIRCIKNSSIESVDYKNRLIGKYLTRQFRHARNKDFYKSNNMTPLEKKAWLNEYSRYLNEEVPIECDKYVTDIFYDRISAIRENDITKLQLYEKINDLNIAISNQNKMICKQNEIISDIYKELNLINKNYKDKNTNKTIFKKILKNGKSNN